MASGAGATVRWSKVICKQPGNYIGWPTIGRKYDGELLVVFSGDREAHRCPYGKNQMIRSIDGGDTWSDVETINSSPLDDRDTGMTILRSGTIVASWFTGASWDPRNLQPYWESLPDHTFDAWRRHVSKITDEARQRWHGHWTRRSTDGGHTWEAAADSIATAPHGPVQLGEGRLIFVGNADVDGRRALVAAESTDEARSWQTIGTIPVPAEHLDELPYDEPHSVEVDDGRIVCLWRYEPAGSRDQWYMRQSESADGGRTWSVTHPTPMWGFPPHLIRLDDGSLLASYGHRRPPYGQRACLSRDGGETWDIENEIILRDDAHSDDLGYPASVELKKGELLTVYYQVDRVGEKTSLMATRWSLPAG